MDNLKTVNLIGVICVSENQERIFPPPFKDIFHRNREEILEGLKIGKKIITLSSGEWEIYELEDTHRKEWKGGKVYVFIPVEREMTHLYSMIIHELKNPIAAIRAMVQVMEASIREGLEDRDKMLEYSSLIVEEIDRMNRILSSIMKLAKPRTRFDYRFDLLETVKKAMGTWSEEFKAQGIKMSLISNRDKLLLLGNPDEIHQIINNLLRNSREALEGVKNPRVTVTIWDSGREVTLRVKDNGKGVTPEVLRKINTSFYSSKPQGLGLGLFIVKTIVKRRRGSIKINSSPGKGFEIVIKLPKK